MDEKETGHEFLDDDAARLYEIMRVDADATQHEAFVSIESLVSDTESYLHKASQSLSTHRLTPRPGTKKTMVARVPWDSLRLVGVDLKDCGLGWRLGVLEPKKRGSIMSRETALLET